jgi:hypothetical protein
MDLRPARPFIARVARRLTNAAVAAPPALNWLAVAQTGHRLHGGKHLEPRCKARATAR